MTTSRYFSLLDPEEIAFVEGLEPKAQFRFLVTTAEILSDFEDQQKVAVKLLENARGFARTLAEHAKVLGDTQGWIAWRKLAREAKARKLLLSD